MTYEVWVKSAEILDKKADDFNEWRSRAKHFVLSNLAPRIAALSGTGYYGCGFHYDMELRLAKAITQMAMPAQFSSNHLDKVEAQLSTIMVVPSIVSSLTKQVISAENSIGKSSKYMQELSERNERKSALSLKRAMRAAKKARVIVE